MPIPKNITREHILKAIERIDKEGVPAEKGYRSTACLYQNKLYPVKLVVTWANVEANGYELDNSPNNFQTQSARKYLEKMGFKVIKIKNND